MSNVLKSMALGICPCILLDLLFNLAKRPNIRRILVIVDLSFTVQLAIIICVDTLLLKLSSQFTKLNKLVGSQYPPHGKFTHITNLHYFGLGHLYFF